jgi:hypothetical protein
MDGAEPEFQKILSRFRPQSAQEPPSEVRWGHEKEPPPMAQPQGRPTSRRPGDGDWWKHGKFFRLPFRLFGSGLAAQAGPTAGWLLVALYDQANRRSATRFKVTDRILAANTALSGRTLVKARKILADKGLIEFLVRPGQAAEYTLLKVPETDIPTEQRPRAKRKPRGRTAQKAKEDGSELWGDLPQNLRGTGAKYARPYAKVAHLS